MEYLFDAQATMKNYNSDKWFIMSDIIPQIKITSDTLKEALHKYQEKIENEYGVTISNNALKNKEAMYNNDIQTGYVITASTYFNNDYKGWIKQYIDLWVTISCISIPDFEKEA